MIGEVTGRSKRQVLDAGNRDGISGSEGSLSGQAALLAIPPLKAFRRACQASYLISKPRTLQP